MIVVIFIMCFCCMMFGWVAGSKEYESKERERKDDIRNQRHELEIMKLELKNKCPVCGGKL